MKLVIATVVGLLAVTGVAQAKEQIRIVGSSTVFPFTTAVAENFGKSTGFTTPVVESTGTGGGMKLFCAGVGTQHPDLTNASRAIKSSEKETCAKNGVTPIEIKVGYDGIVLANAKSGPTFSLGLKDIFLALAAEIPDGKGGFISNPNQTWKDVRADLPNIKIEVLGPPPTSGTRDAFVELAMEGGAKSFPELAALRKKDKKAFNGIAHHLREDGLFIEAGENDNLIVQKLEANPNAVGVFGFSFLDQNAEKMKGAVVDGVSPEFENIAEGKYKVSRSLFVYAKKEHLSAVGGMREFVNEYTSEKAFGDEGYLIDKGLIPLLKEERDSVRRAVKSAM